MMRNPWVAGLLLCLGAIAVVYNVRVYAELLGGRAADDSANVETLPPTDEEVTDEELDGAPVALAPISHEAVQTFLAVLVRTDRDPFRFAEARLSGADGGAPPPFVHGVLIGEGRRVAWIGDRAAVVGDEVDGYIVVSIEADGVTVVHAGTEHRLVPHAPLLAPPEVE
jgi:hypothetical protein